MLHSLSIRNYILIDSLDVNFPEGLCIVTGQTGAGKSIILGALSLLTGAKADASMISQGADSCVVEGEFLLEDKTLEPIFEENDVEWDEGRVLVRRVLSRSGRARSFVNDSPVNQAFLAELSTHLIDIHSQNHTAILSDKRFQLSLLDNFAGNSKLLQDCAGAYRSCASIKEELSSLEQKLARMVSERDYIDAQYKQLDAARLREGELAELEHEQKQLANAESIKESLGAVQNLLDPEEGMGVETSLREAERLLERLSPLVPSLEDLAQRMQSARIELTDIAQAVEQENERVSVSGERLEQVEERMSLLYTLLKKFSCEDEAALIALRDEYSSQLFDSESIEERISDLKKQLSKAEETYSGICSKLHESRVKAAPKFAERVLSMLRFLELDKSVFEVEVLPATDSASGRDEVKYLFDALGARPSEVAKCASGGERSRIMLCLKALMAEFKGMPTMIFDEIDTGVSGSAADSMGSMICSMGERMQVLAITHLPQVAAKGDSHFVVEKNGVTTIRRVEGEERVMEIARLLSGAKITDEAVANARSLLKSN